MALVMHPELGMHPVQERAREKGRGKERHQLA